MTDQLGGCYPHLASHMTSLTLRSLMQPSCRNFTTLQILIPPATNSQQSALGMAPWEGECHVRATVQSMAYDRYDVQRMKYDKYNVQRMTVQHGHTR